MVRKKRHGKASILVLLLASDYKRLDTSSYFSPPHGPQENVSHDMNSPTLPLYATIGVGRRGVEEGLGPSLHFEILHFPIINLAKKLFA